MPSCYVARQGECWQRGEEGLVRRCSPPGGRSWPMARVRLLLLDRLFVDRRLD